MDYFAAFEISRSALEIEKLRSDIGALNLANANSVYSDKSSVYKPMRVISTQGGYTNASDVFDNMLNSSMLKGVSVGSIQNVHNNVKEVYDPKHPAADKNGFIYKPDINTASEMIEMMMSLRSYQANIKAIAATKAMVEEALKIGAQ